MLKDCPKGMKLDCTMFDNVYFDKICNDKGTLYPIKCYTLVNGIKYFFNFTNYGKFNTMKTSKCVIFPKGKTTWEGFVPPCKFKVGDIVQYEDECKVKITKINIDNELYEYESVFAKGIGSILFSEQDDWELVPNKFDITTLKPFDKVLVRLTNNCVWMPKLFSHYDTESKMKYYPFITTDNIGYIQCIPYKGE